MNDLTLIIICAAALVLIIVAWVIAFKMGDASRKKKDEAEIGSAEAEAKRIIEAAKKEGESKKKEAILEAKEENHKSRQELDKEIKDRRNEISRQERRIQQKEENLDKKTDAIEKKEEALSKKDKDLDALREEIEKIKQKELNMLEQLAGLSKDEAKQYLLEKLENEVKHEAAIMVKDIEAQAKENAEKTAKNIIAGAIQKCAADHVAEATVSVVNLPNEEMKGRIIGREGRNIRTLETLTGIDLIIDDTPEAVILSGFDPVRREIARLSLEKLIVDGRIHPARIEEMYEKAKKEVETQIKQEGENATFETGVHGLHPEIIKLLGKLRFRTSYGQNVLKHSIEVSHIAGLIAGELGADITMAKRAGLLHDLGKAADHEMEGSHVTIGADLAKKYKESKDIVHAIMAHHGDIEATTVVAVIVQAADAISAARPGARRETLETYTNRLKQLEDISNSFKGVDKSFAIQAGREVRVMVIPDQINDDEMVLLARDLSKQIEAELQYPGQIKVNVIRESRVVDYAK